MQSPARPTTLDSLLPGQSGRLGEPLALSPEVFRLIEMGLTPGAVVSVTRRAPLGGPLEVRVRGTRLCLRRDDAARFPVAPGDAP